VLRLAPEIYLLYFTFTLIGAGEGVVLQKTEGRKSRDNVPLSHLHTTVIRYGIVLNSILDLN
jgi:hypothetical protein